MCSRDIWSNIIFQWKFVFDDSKELDDPQVSDGLKVISNGNVDYNDPKELNDPQVLDDPKWISIQSMDFDNLKFYGDTSIFDVIVGGNLYVREIQMLFN